MNIYIFELRMLKLWPWLVGIAGIVVTIMSMYPLITRDVDDFMNVLNSMNPAFVGMFGMDLAVFTNVLGFFAFALNYIKMIMGVQAMLWGASLMTKERRFHTAEFVLAKPCPRRKILTAKIAAVSTGLMITSVVFMIMSVIMLAVYGDGYSRMGFFKIFFGLPGFQLVFLSIGIFVGVAAQKLKNPLSITLAAVFGTYIAGSLGAMNDSGLLKLLSPYEYFSASDILHNGHYGVTGVVVALALAALCIFGSYYVFERQDVR